MFVHISKNKLCGGYAIIVILRVLFLNFILGNIFWAEYYKWRILWFIVYCRIAVAPNVNVATWSAAHGIDQHKWAFV